MELTGKIKLIKDEQTVGNNGFRKREMVLTTDEQYPQHLLIEFTQDRCSLLDNFTINQEVKVSVNLRGREWISPSGEVKYFNSINGWKISAIEQVLTPPPQEEMPTLVDDLPFDVDDISEKDPYPF